jgi:hypothetical protein
MSKPTMMIVQRMKRSERDVYKRAQKYYMIVSAVNELALTEREIQLVAFTAVRGNISYSNNRQEFCELYKSSPPTINNIISKLKRIGLFVKEGTKVKVNPVITLDFEKDVTLEIKLINEGDGEAS